MKFFHDSFRILTASSALVVSLTVMGEGPAERLFPVTGWQVVGAEVNEVVREGSLTIPASAQLFRSVPTTGTRINLRMEPEWGGSVADMPIFEFGEFALSFSRQEGAVTVRFFEGIEGEGELIYSRESPESDELALEITRSSSSITIGLPDGVFHRELPVQSPMVDLVLSSGGTTDWRINQLHVSTVPVVPANEVFSRGLSVTERVELRQQLEARYGSGPLDDGATGSNRLDGRKEQFTAGDSLSAEEEQLTEPYRGLEIFTPASVRKGRADAIRDVLRGSTND
jgi:hypothetical protein